MAVSTALAAIAASGGDADKLVKFLKDAGVSPIDISCVEDNLP